VRGLATTVVERLSAGEGTFERPPGSDVLLAVVAAVPAAAAMAVSPVWRDARGIAPGWLGWLLLTLMFVPLVWRRVAPVVTITVTGLATGVYAILGFDTSVALLAVLIALYSVTAYGTRSDGRTSLAISIFFIATSLISVYLQGVALNPLQVVVTLFVFVGIWALGDRTRARREVVAQLTARAEDAERTRGLLNELALSDERARIARELHDVVAHTVSVVVVQAGAARRVVEQRPDRALEVLGDIERTGRGALVDLRRLVGVLRDEGPALLPQPDLAALPELIERLKGAGLPVVLRYDGVPRPLPQGVELSAYRIVQEGLTNVLKHAGQVTAVQVELLYGSDTLTVVVRDDGRGAASGSASSGSGLLGMRERIAMFSGDLQAGARHGGGFEVRACLPLHGHAPQART
jgi:signal transduction histidine kinase